jgi:hypothetical protein
LVQVFLPLTTLQTVLVVAFLVAAELWGAVAPRVIRAAATVAAAARRMEACFVFTHTTVGTTDKHKNCRPSALP